MIEPAAPPRTIPSAVRRRSYWREFWFAPTGPGALGFGRLLFFALLIWYYRDMDFTLWGEAPASFANKVLFYQRYLPIPILSPRHLAQLELIWKGSMVLGCIGLFTRPALWVQIITMTYLLSVPGRFGKMGHGEGILVFTSLILALSRCGDAWSIDALRKSYARRDVHDLRPVSGEYTWPIKLIWLLMSMIFLAAGVAKLRISGLEWVTSDTLANTIHQHFYGHYGLPMGKLGLWMAQQKTLCRILAAATMVIELGFPLSLFNRWLRAFFVPAMFMAQIGILVMMGIDFTKFMYVYLFFVPWAAVGFGLRRVLARSGVNTFLYDGGCGLCKSVASVGRRIDLLSKMQFIDGVHEWPRIHEKFPMLDRDKVLNDIHLVDSSGKVYTRFKAYRRAMWDIPVFWPVLPLMYLPPVPQIADRIYGYVALHRHDAGCALP